MTNTENALRFQEVPVGQYRTTFWWLDGREIPPTVEVFVVETAKRAGHWRHLRHRTAKYYGAVAQARNFASIERSRLAPGLSVS